MSEKEPPKANAEISKFVSQSQVDAGATVNDTTLVIPDMPKEDRDRLLGIYMGRVSALEGVLQILLWRLLQTDMATSFSVFTLLGFRQLEELLPALSRIALKDVDQKSLTSLCRRLNKFAAKRNKIVHGRWNTHLSVSAKDGKPVIENTEWMRVFAPTDPSQQAKIGKDQKITSKYQFSLDNINQASIDADALGKDFETFTNSLAYLPDPPHFRQFPEPQKPAPETTQ